MHGYVTHGESVALMRSADLLFLPMQNLPPGVRATIVPGKTYEYLASGDADPRRGAGGRRARHPGRGAATPSSCRPDDVDGDDRDASGAQIEAFRAGTRPPEPRADVVARFEYRHLAEQLAGVFDEVLAKR